MENKNESEYLEFKRLERNLMAAKNGVKWADNIDAYDKYINFVAYLIRVIAYPENALSAAYATSILIRDGIFSRDGKFRYTYPMDTHIEGFLGLNVVNGYGNSRNISSFINDVLNKMGYMSYTLYARVSSEENLNDNQKKANQALNLIEYDGTLYAFDAINNVFYAFTDKDKMKQIYSDRPLYAYYDKRADIVLNNIKADAAESLISLFNSVKENEIIDGNEFKSMIDYTNRQIYRRGLIIFDETVRFSKQYIDEIVNGLPRYDIGEISSVTAHDNLRKKK